MYVFGQVLSCLLLEKNIGKSSFAKEVHISNQRLSSILSGRQLPDGELLMKMAYALDADHTGNMLLYESYKLNVCI